ncbi:MAG: fibronectin type III domain-containing protein [Candidatus Cloacimonadaceae bacterium]
MFSRRGKVITYILLFVILLLSFSQLSAEDRASGYAIYGPITINTMSENYTEFRIIPHPHAPNPDFLEIPEGGFGYAWFIVEGLSDGIWKPVPAADITARDTQGNQLTAVSGVLPYHFLGEHRVSTQDTGAFALKIPASFVGDGTPCSVGTITVEYVNGVLLGPDNDQSIFCGVIPFRFKKNWGYRVYSEVGAGVTQCSCSHITLHQRYRVYSEVGAGVTTGVTTATGFIGGGAGSTIQLKLSGLSSCPDIDSLIVKRRGDFYMGSSADIGLFKFISLSGSKAGGKLKSSFPYEHEYRFNYNQMSGWEALAAIYLFDESNVYRQGSNKPQQMNLMMISCQAQALLENQINDILSDYHVSDETGIEAEGCAGFGAGILGNNLLKVALNADFDNKAHVGCSLKKYLDGREEKRYHVDGKSNLSISLGPEPIGGQTGSAFYIDKLAWKFNPIEYNCGYEMQASYAPNGAFSSIKVMGHKESTDRNLNVFNLPGISQKYQSYFKIDNDNVYNYLTSSSLLAQRLSSIGQGDFEQSLSNHTFNQNLSGFLRNVHNQQSEGNPVHMEFGNKAFAKSEYSFDLELNIPVLPGKFIHWKMGNKVNEEDEYDLAKGHWVKGYPYLNSEMLQPVNVDYTLDNVITALWQKVRSSDAGDFLSSILSQKLFMGIIPILNIYDRSEQTYDLNNYGSSITVTSASFPAGIDSVAYSYWTWGDEREAGRDYTENELKVIKMNQNTRQIREEIIGMHYGIGGFYDFDSTAPEWNDDPMLKISYQDSEVNGIDENDLKMYWEDDLGNWHLINSVAVPDSNYVYANIPYFATYTLAPKLPQGEFTLAASPDSLLADGSSTATISSSVLRNNDGTLVADGTLYTVSTSRGRILTPDADTLTDGIQVPALGSMISFTVQADSVPHPISLSASAQHGYSNGSMIINLYQVIPPSQPTLLSIQPEHRALRVTWQEVSDPGVVGYKIYYDVDASGVPYNGTSNVSGLNSPVFVGNTDSYTLTGLYNNDVYYVAVAAVDAYGLESIVSNEMQAQPVLRAVQSLNLEPIATGMKLTWQPSFGAENYKIYRADDPNAPINEMTLIGQTNSLFWVDTSVQSHYRGFYVVVAEGY